MRPALSASPQRTPRQALGRVGAVVVTAWLVAGPAGRTAHAADAVTPATCVAANEEAGPLRRAGKLREARAKLRLCSAQTCPVAVRKDCVAGAAQADSDVPTVAFSVQDPDGNDLTAVRISLDGQSVAESLDGKALDVDPGEHVFRFESVGLPTVEKRFVIVEGEKNRRERVQMGEPKPVVAIVAARPAPEAPPPPPNTKRTVGLAVGGGGLVVAAVGGVFGLIATLQWNNAKTACGSTFPLSCSEPVAANADRSASIRAGTVADVLVGVGGVAVVTGVTLALLSPTSTPRSATAAWTLAPQAGPGMSGFVLRGSF